MPPRNFLVTGGAGFIGSHLVRELLKRGNVAVIDNLSTGKASNLEAYKDNPGFSLVQADLSEQGFEEHFSGIDEVFHLASTSRVNTREAGEDVFFRNGVLATRNVLEAMRRKGVKSITFTSTSTVYGEADALPTPEDYPTHEPISQYAVAKLMCELLISSYHRFHGFKTIILRLANAVGPRGHGVIHDFIWKLGKDPRRLDILGNGEQDKSYIHVSDCVSAFLHCMEKCGPGYHVFNLGSRDTIKVRRIAEIVSEEMGLQPEYSFGTTRGGWRGDVPEMWLDIKRITGLGWQPLYNSEEAVRKTVRDIIQSS